MKHTLPVRGHELGWIRVAVALAATGTIPDGSAVAAWLKAHPEHPQLTPGLMSAPSLAAKALGFLDDALGATDAGRALHWIENPQGGPDADSLTLSLPVRWLLWAGTASAEPAFWRAALAEWRPEPDLFDWMVSVARALDQRGEAGHLARLISKADAQGGSRVSLTQVHARPWLGQLESLGWTPRLGALHAWAQTSPDPWDYDAIWHAFRVAEDLSPGDAQLADLRTLLASLPADLRGIGGQEAAERTVQLCGTAVALGEGHPQSWYGPSWEALLAEASALGLHRKSGATTTQANLAWPVAFLDAPAVSRPASVPVELAEALPKELPRAAEVVASDEDERARSWLRCVAWWASGPTAGDLMALGHDSWGLWRWTLAHWLDEGQIRYLDSRIDPIHEVRWLDQALGHLAAPSSTALCRVLAERQVAVSVRRAALSRLQADVPPPLHQLAQWIADGNVVEWAELERATRAWLAGLVERGATSPAALLARLQKCAHGSAAEATDLLANLGHSDGPQTLLLEGRLSVLGQLPPDLGLNFSCHPEDVNGPFQIVRFSLEVRQTTIQNALSTGPRLAREELRKVGPDLVIQVPDQLDALYSEAGDLVAPEVAVMDNEVGIGTWWETPPNASKWLTRHPPADIRWNDREREEFQSAMRLEDIVDQILGLWVTIEHGIPDGASGNPVLEQLAQAAAAAVFFEQRREARDLAERFGVPAPGLDEDWAAWAHWEPKVPCTWAQHRLDGFGSAIREPKVFRQARTRALSNTMWLFSALYAVRNRRVHEAFRPEARDLPRLTRLFEACRVLTASLINQRDGAGRWEAAGELLRALEPKKQQEAFMPCTLLDHLGSGRS